MAALLVGEVGILSGTTQQALADKVGPHPDEDNVKQGAMGEYFSKDGREAYGGTSDRARRSGTKIMQGPETMKVVMNHSESTTLEKTSE